MVINRTLANAHCPPRHMAIPFNCIRKVDCFFVHSVICRFNWISSNFMNKNQCYHYSITSICESLIFFVRFFFIIFSFSRSICDIELDRGYPPFCFLGKSTSWFSIYANQLRVSDPSRDWSDPTREINPGSVPEPFEKPAPDPTSKKIRIKPNFFSLDF